jgi:hypothetical protein
MKQLEYDGENGKPLCHRKLPFSDELLMMRFRMALPTLPPPFGSWLCGHRPFFPCPIRVRNRDFDNAAPTLNRIVANFRQ